MGARGRLLLAALACATVALGASRGPVPRQLGKDAPTAARRPLRPHGPLMAAVDPSVVAAASAVDVGYVLRKASMAALGGGASGAAAGVVQVFSLMWLRTTVNYQYREGGSTAQALATLWKEGGIGRLYQGLPYALLQTPLTRFGDTAANTGVPIILDAFAGSAALPAFVRQVAPSLVSAVWRTALLPVDTVKTTLQVDGASGMAKLRRKVDAVGPSALWEGAWAAAGTTFLGSYPWWLTFNTLQQAVPAVDPASDHAKLVALVRVAAIGFTAVCVSDTVSNSVRVVKTTKQTAPETISYAEALKLVVDKDGVAGLLTRGLGTKLLANGVQGALFSVLWKYFEQQLTGKPLR